MRTVYLVSQPNEKKAVFEGDVQACRVFIQEELERLYGLFDNFDWDNGWQYRHPRSPLAWSLVDALIWPAGNENEASDDNQ